ncbi:hypothetical protein [Streptomyces sp. NBC_01233]|uniref:hypothetical protein n=1 Tax=Streptomyces sp. NBC_01233 TaxID=2903787 RepID=UPI002E1646B8|nr:hypothetical protein OG332_24320 [Streptomyces sp. NBC_01233]
MDALELLLCAVDVADDVASSAPVWGPVLTAVGAVASWWRLRPTGRHRGGGTPWRTVLRTGVRAVVRLLADTGPERSATNDLTCEDTCPDVSEDTCPGAPGHEEKGAR